LRWLGAILSAANTAYDARWMEKEEICFSKWMNWTLVPNSENLTPTTISIEEDDGGATFAVAVAAGGFQNAAAVTKARATSIATERQATIARIARILIINKTLIGHIERVRLKVLHYGELIDPPLTLLWVDRKWTNIAWPSEKTNICMPMLELDRM